jgi:hypothetical protein
MEFYFILSFFVPFFMNTWGVICLKKPTPGINKKAWSFLTKLGTLVRDLAYSSSGCSSALPPSA